MNIALNNFITVPTATYAGTAAEDDSLALSADNGVWVEQDHDLEVEPVVAELQDTYHQPQLQETVGVTAQNAWTTPKVGLVAAGGILGGLLVGAAVGMALGKRSMLPALHLKQIRIEQYQREKRELVKQIGRLEQSIATKFRKVELVNTKHIARELGMRRFTPDEAYAILQSGDHVFFRRASEHTGYLYEVQSVGFRSMILRNLQTQEEIPVSVSAGLDNTFSDIVEDYVYVGFNGSLVETRMAKFQRSQQEGGQRGIVVDSSVIEEAGYQRLTRTDSRFRATFVETGAEQDASRKFEKEVRFHTAYSRDEDQVHYRVYMRVRNKREAIEILKELMRKFDNVVHQSLDINDDAHMFALSEIRALAYEHDSLYDYDEIFQNGLSSLLRRAERIDLLGLSDVQDLNDFLREEDGDYIMSVSFSEEDDWQAERGKVLTRVLADHFDLREYP